MSTFSTLHGISHYKCTCNTLLDAYCKTLVLNSFGHLNYMSTFGHLQGWIDLT
jgi:hypothetical protein